MLTVNYIKRLHCNHCGGSWYPRTSVPPAVCPKCHSMRWNKKRQIRIKKTDIVKEISNTND